MSSKKHKHNTTKSSSTELLICNSKECVDDQDKDSLTCAKCKRSIHYRCTMLPAYQIQMFVNLKPKITQISMSKLCRCIS